MKKQFFAAVGATLTLIGGVTAMSQNAMASTIDTNHDNLETAPVLLTRISRWSNSLSVVLRKQPVTNLSPTHVMVMFVNPTHASAPVSEKALSDKNLSRIISNFDMLVDMDVKDIPGFEEGIEIHFSDTNGTMVKEHLGISQINTNDIYYFVQFGEEENYEYGRAYYGTCAFSDEYLQSSETECRLSPEQRYGMNSYKVAQQGDEYTELNDFGIYASKEQKFAAEEAKRKAIEEAARLELERLEAEKAAVEEELVQLEAEKVTIGEELAQLEAEKTAIEEELKKLEAERLEAINKAAEEEEAARIELERLEAEKAATTAELTQLETKKTAIEEELARLEAKKAEMEQELARLETEREEVEKTASIQPVEVVKTVPIISYVVEDKPTVSTQNVQDDQTKTEVKSLELPALGEEKSCEKVEEANSFFDNWWWAIAIVSFILGGLLLDVKVYKTSRK